MARELKLAELAERVAAKKAASAAVRNEFSMPWTHEDHALLEALLLKLRGAMTNAAMEGKLTEEAENAMKTRTRQVEWDSSIIFATGC